MITIHAPAGVRLSHLARQLIDLAGGDRTQVRSGRGGLIVDERLAHTYLTRRIYGPNPTPAAPPQFAPPAITEMVRGHEDRGGLTAPTQDDDRKPAAVRPARTRGAARGA